MVATRDKPIKLEKLDTSQYLHWVDIAKNTFEIFEVWDVVDGSSPDPTPAGVNSDNYNDPTFLALSAAQRDAIKAWKHRHRLAKEAIVSSLPPEEYSSIRHLQYAAEIWDQLKQEYGQTFDIKRACVEQQFRSLKKSKATPMDLHIKQFKQLKAEVNYHAPPGVLPMDRALVNLQFLTSLISTDDAMENHIWETFQTALSVRANTIPMEQLFAEVKAKDLARNPSSLPSSQPEDASTSQAMVGKLKQAGEKPKNQWKSSSKQERSQPYPPRNSQNQQFNSNFHFDRSKWCGYCKENGHAIEECAKRYYYNV
jgi:hypothetical protein